MKKLFVLTLTIAALCSGSLLAQVKVISNGNVGINNTNPTYKLDVAGTFRAAASSSSIVYSGTIFSPAYGSYVDLGSYGNYWYNLFAYYPYFYYEPTILSDIRLKTDIKPLPLLKDKILMLNPVSYKLNPELPGDTPQEVSERLANDTQYGFIAQEIEEIFPELVISAEDDIKGIRYTGLIPVMVQAFKEQQMQIEALEKRIAELESRIK